MIKKRGSIKRNDIKNERGGGRRMKRKIRKKE